MANEYDNDPNTVSIDKNVPIPRRVLHGRAEQYWTIVSKRMAVGDSVLITTKNPTRVRAISSYAKTVLNRLHPNKTFITRRIDDCSFRVWRTE